MSAHTPSKQQLVLDFSRPSERSAPPPIAPPTSEAEVLRVHRRRIEGFLSTRLPEPVDLTFTRNRSTMISSSRRQGRVLVRLHRLFRHADESTLEQLALFLGGGRGRRSSASLDRFIAAHREEVDGIGAPPRRSRRLREHGLYHDLGAIIARVEREYFGGSLGVRIGWGVLRRPGKRRRRASSRALATYSFEDRTIRVSPVLDALDVPDYVLEWIVYHELLHHVVPIERSGGRKRFHTRRFRTLERGFARFAEAQAWEKANLERLLS